MRKRIVSLTVLAAVLAIALFGIPLAAGVVRYYLADEQGELQRVADEATIAVSRDLLRGHDSAEMPATEPGIRLGLYNPAGHRISGRGPAEADAAVRGALRAHVTTGSSGGDLVVSVPIADNERVVAVIRAAASRWQVYLRIGRTWLVMLAIGVVAIMFTWLIARRQGRRLAQPIEEMAATAQRLGDGDFSVRNRPTGIPEIDTAGASLDVTAERLGTLLTRERAFSADASHQLRTPLTGLRLRLEAARDTPGVDTHAAITSAITAADRLERTINELLALARDTPHRTEPLRVNALLEEVRQTWHADLAARGRPLRIEIGPELPVCRASTAAVRQILDVLIDNAVRHGAGAVTIHVREAGDALAIDVTDEGTAIGDDPGDLFRRRTAANGHGIGLAMARSLAEAEGGRLLLSRPSPPTFTLLLPARQ
ncbi:MAG: two-component sensor histidine kinase [Actinomycetia bacterium]|nr:two-component sensor histidine kinase [Actinomycetes bacterium]